MWKTHRTALASALAGSAAAVALGLFTTPSQAKHAFEDTTYWFMWACVLLPLWILRDMRAAGELARIDRARSARALAVALALAGAIHFGVGSAYRVLADETNLLSTSLSFYTQRTAFNITEAVSHGGTLHVIAGDIPTRPCLYPFVVSLLHTPLGYRPEHGFAVSLAAAFATLLAVAVWGRRLASEGYGLLAAVLVAALPVFQLAATSCGFESLNLLFVVLVAMQTCAVVERPSALRVELLLALSVLAAHCRYEAAVLFLPALAACAFRARALLSARFHARLGVYPALLLPLLWQRRLTSVINNGGDGVASPFSAGAIPRHLCDLAELFFAPGDPAYPTLRVLSVLAVFGAALVLARAWRARREVTAGLALVACGAALIVLVQAAFYLGDLRLAFQSRFATSHAAVLGMLAAYPLHRASVRLPSARVAVLGVLACVLATGLGVASENARGKSLLAHRVYANNLSFLGAYDHRSTLVIARAPGMFTAQSFGAVGLPFVEAHLRELEARLDDHRYQDVFLLREGDCVGDVRGLDLGPAYEQTVARVIEIEDSRCEHIVRIERRPDAVVAPASASRQARASR